MRAALSALWAFLTVCVTTLGGAQEAAHSGYSLSLVRGEGAEQCPSGREITREVERRIGRPVFDNEGTRSFEVQLNREGDIYHSWVYVRGADGQSIGRRALESSEASCGPIFEATVLSIALVIDPNAALPERASSVAAFAPLSSQSAAPPASNASPSSATARAPSGPPIPTKAPPEGRHTEIEISARALLSKSIVPGASGGLSLHFSARPTERWGVALGAVYLGPGQALTSAGEVWVGLTSATLGITFEAAAARRVRLMLEAGAWAGVLQSTVLRPTPNGSGPFPFLALDVGAHVEVRLTRGLFAELGFVGLTPLVRHELLVAPTGQTLWHEPALGGLLFFGLGASFR